jgi:putative NADH-flavin reductase
MRILTFGATGLTGRRLVDSAVDRGYGVSAFVRDPTSAAFSPGVRVIRGDVTDRGDVDSAVDGHDAVLCALGAATPLRRSPGLVAGVGHIVAAMTNSGVHRLIYLSFLGVPAGRHQLSVLGRRVVAPILLRNVAKDHTEKEEIVRRSGLDWTLVRPPRLTNGPATGNYRYGDEIRASQIVPRISRDDVAEFMIDQLDDPRSIGRALAIMP